MAPPLTGARVVDLYEELGKRTHLGRAEHGLRRSFAQGGSEHRAGQLLAHVAAQGIEKHTLRCRRLAIAAPATPEPAGVSHQTPVRGAVDRAMEPGGVDKRLQQQQRMAETHWPITHDPARAQPQHPRPEIGTAPPRQKQQPGVVGDQMKPSILGAEVGSPSPPRRRAPGTSTQYRGRKHRQGEPRPVEMRHIPQRLSDLGQGAQIRRR